jgi:hypothetical protein
VHFSRRCVTERMLTTCGDTNADQDDLGPRYALKLSTCSATRSVTTSRQVASYRRLRV